MDNQQSSTVLPTESMDISHPVINTKIPKSIDTLQECPTNQIDLNVNDVEEHSICETLPAMNSRGDTRVETGEVRLWSGGDDGENEEEGIS